MLWPCRFNDIFYVCWNPQEVVSHRFYRLAPRHVDTQPKALWALLNTSLVWLCAELFAGSSLGAGVLDINGQTIKQIPMVRPERVPVEELMEISSALEGERLGDLSDHLSAPSLRALDRIIFDVLGLTQGEQDGVYEAVAALVTARLGKAGSLRKGR